MTFTVASIAGLALLIKVARPLLPPDPPNRLQYETSDFLLQGSRQQVDWWPYGPEAFAEAKRKGKPILLLIGAKWSPFGRLADEEVFHDSDVEAALATNFTCIRADLSENPELIGAILPVRRARRASDPGFQVCFLDYDGRVFADAGELGYGPLLNSIEFLNVLRRISAEYDARKRGTATEAIGGAQASERAAIYSAITESSPDFQTQYNRVMAEGDPKRGGFPIRGVSRLNPNAFRFLFDAGRYDELRSLLDPLLRGGHVDWLDGGFFEQVWFVGRKQVDFDKLAMRNAEMMETLALAGTRFKDKFYLELARRTFDSLSGEFVRQDVPAGARIGDEAPDGRSVRSSISVIDLRRTLVPPVRVWARRYMDLQVESNPCMNIRMPHPDVLNTGGEKFALVLKQLKSTRVDNRSFSEVAICESAAYVTARLLATARLLGDGERKATALRLWNNLQEFRAGEDVRRTLRPDVAAKSVLADYLAFSDACLQAFLLTGDAKTLDIGRRLLLRAEFLFRAEASGIWLPASGMSGDGSPVDIDLPEVFDYTRESTTAMAVRLCTAYGRTRRNENDRAATEEAVHLYQLGTSTIGQFADDSHSLAFGASGYFTAAMEYIRGGHIAVTGPDAVARAAKIKGDLPSLFVYPAIGSVRPDIQKLGAGYYWIRHANKIGPLTYQQVVERAVSERPELRSLP